jgi:1-acyl-sn-glycerol-3-phosphate acyltransferase
MSTFFQALVYYVNLTWVRLILFVVSSRDIKGRERVPRKGGLILVCNHLNNADPPVLTHATPRKISWLTKTEWFSTPIVGPLMRLAGMIPVRRFAADLVALRRAQELLASGGCLGMFPEGTRSHGAGLKAGEPGSALIALRSGAAVQPVAIWGTENVKLPRDLLRRTRVHVRFGESFALARPKRIARGDIETATHRIMMAIAEMLPPELRGVYGDPTAALATGEDAETGTNR